MYKLALLLALVVLCNGNLVCDSVSGLGDGGELWFRGFQGQSFPFLGHADGIYLIYSDPYVVINSRFDLATPEHKSSDFTIMAAVGIKTSSSEIEIERSSFKHKGTVSLKVNSEEVHIAEKKAHQIGNCVSIVYENDHSMVIITPYHKIRVQWKHSHSHHINTEYLNIGFAEEFYRSVAYGGVWGQTFDHMKISKEESDFIVDSLFSTNAKKSTFTNSEFVCKSSHDFGHKDEAFRMIRVENVEQCEEGYFCASDNGKTMGCKPIGCDDSRADSCAPGTTCLAGNCLRNDEQPCSDDSQCFNGECQEDYTCGCLTPDSLILLEDGITEVRADQLKTGDRIFTYPKGAVTVEHIYVHPYTGMIYSLDGSNYFFTADHPFPSGTNINKTLLGDVEHMIPKGLTDVLGKDIFKAFGADASPEGNIAQMENGQQLQFFNKSTGTFELREIKNLKFTFVTDLPVYTIYFKEENAPYLSVANGYLNGFNIKSSVAHEGFLLNLATRQLFNEPTSIFTQLPKALLHAYNYMMSQ